MARRSGPRCTATRKDGTPCLGWRLPGSDFCLAHDPSPERQRQHRTAHRVHADRLKAEAAEAKAAADGNPALLALKPPSNRAELRDMISLAVLWTLQGTLDPKRADAAIKLAQRGMSLFADEPEPDPHESMTDEQLAEALRKELRAVEARLPTAEPSGGNGHSQRPVEDVDVQPGSELLVAEEVDA